MANFDPSRIFSVVQEIAEQCTRCALCQKNCSFLQKYGLPGDIAEKYRLLPRYVQDISFSCSLCGLCSAVCPVSLRPDLMSLDLRREAVASGNKNLPDHTRILGYERRGVSPRYTWYSLPKNCNTVFFPGCSLSGSRPQKTLKMYEYLLDLDSTTGIVLDCCTKPSHDLGRQEQFEGMFFELRGYLLSVGVATVIVACPNCYKVFLQYGGDLKVETIYGRIAAHVISGKTLPRSVVTVHDPCAVRFFPEIHAAVRAIIKMKGMIVDEMQHVKELSFCCGEGGCVGAAEGKLAGKWTRRNVEEAGGKLILTYCAGCAGFLHRHAATSHLIDLLFEPQKALVGKAVFARAPLTYYNRLRLKKRLKKEHPAGQWRERPLPVSTGERRKPYFPSSRAAFLFLLIVAGIMMLWHAVAG